LTEILVTNSEEFDQIVGGAVNTLVLFTSPAWCVPCRRFEPHWLKAQETEALSDYKFVKVDMGATPEDTGAHWASQRYRILGVPQVLLFNHDEYREIHARAVLPLIRELLT
jgi:thiol:disulfide interchange protein